MESKHCSCCERDLPWDAFWLFQGKPNGHCKECQKAARKRQYADDAEHRAKVKARSAAHYAANKERANARNRAYGQENREHLGQLARERFLMKKYGITQADYDRLLQDQGGVCAVCLGQPRHGKVNFCVDHCHETGRIRGLLCDYCNRAAGSLENDPLRATRMAAYLA